MLETVVSGRRFALTADTHDDLVDWPAVLASLEANWGGVDAILHCGDITSEAALDALGGLAPVFATRNDGDPPPEPPRLADGPRVLVAGGVRIGLTFGLPETAKSAEGAAQFFGGPVAACVFGGTHTALTSERDGVLFVNPGSPSLAKTRTTAVLTIAGGRAAVEIIALA